LALIAIDLASAVSGHHDHMTIVCDGRLKIPLMFGPPTVQWGFRRVARPVRFRDAECMSSLLSTLSSLGPLALTVAVAAVINSCGLKSLLLVPGAIGTLIVGVLGDTLLWDAAHGRYQDSDTIIFGLPRVAGSADSWFGPVHSFLGLLLLVGFLGLATFALWPKRRPAPEFVVRHSAKRQAGKR
jgi:hypothetical protein